MPTAEPQDESNCARTGNPVAKRAGRQIISLPQAPPRFIKTTRYDRFVRKPQWNQPQHFLAHVRGEQPEAASSRRLRERREPEGFESGFVLQVFINPVEYLAWRCGSVWDFSIIATRVSHSGELR